MDNSEKSLSIIVPMYNAEKSISVLLTSLLNQIDDSIEIILVNDGSLDSTLHICQKIINGNTNFKILSTKNMGVSSARNIGIKNAKGEFLLFVDSDDFISENFVEYFNKNYKNFSQDVLFKIDTKYIKEGSVKKFSYINSCDAVSFRNNLIKGCIEGYSWGYIFKRDIAEKVMYDVGINFMEDLLFLYKYSFYITEVSVIPDVYYFYVFNNSGISQNVNFNEKHIFDCYNVLCNIKTIDSKMDNKLLESKLFSVIESEMGKCEQFDLPTKYSGEFGKLLDEISNKTVNKLKKIYYKYILRQKILFNIYIYIRKNLKKLKGVKR